MILFVIIKFMFLKCMDLQISPLKVITNNTTINFIVQNKALKSSFCYTA